MRSILLATAGLDIVARFARRLTVALGGLVGARALLARWIMRLTGAGAATPAV